jgi:prepilin-type N-terminal cleavage/methylation domain-containing protein
MRPGNAADGTERGFSLLELMVALAVTLVITGAVFQLMSTGQRAFRREPEVADRQQSARVAMDRIWNDVYRAGRGMPNFTQVFNRSLNGVGPTGSGGAATDEIGFVLMSDCEALTVCGKSQGASVTTKEQLSSCYTLPGLVILGSTTEGKYGIFWAELPGQGTNASCTQGSGTKKNGHVVFPKGQGNGFNPPGGQFGFDPEYMAVGEAVAYRIAAETDGTPALWRSGAGNAATAPWALVARGIEDLQIDYYAGGAWVNQPPVAVANNYDTVVERVRIRLSARSSAAGLEGATNSAVGQALRGQLVSEVAPRAARIVMAGKSGGA